MTSFFKTPIEFLKGLGPQKAAHINKELGIFTYADLLQHYPFRYEDRTKFYKIRELNGEMSNVQVKGQIRSKQLVGLGRKQRLAVQFADETGTMELVWFSGINWISPKLKNGVDYVVYGQPKRFGKQIHHGASGVGNSNARSFTK